MNQIRIALRTLFKSPFITFVAVLSIALGIGANTAIFSLFDQLLLESMPVQAPDRLVNVGQTGPMMGSTSCNQAGDCDEIFSYPMYRDLERQQESLAGLAGHRSFGANIAIRNQTRSGSGMLVSGTYFPLLGVQPRLGRLFSPSDDESPGAHPIAVLSHDYWETELGSDPGVLNQSIVVNGHPFTVVGVSAAGFRGTTKGAEPDLFVPLSMRSQTAPGWDQFDNRRSHWIYVFGRLRDGATADQSLQSLNGLYSSIIQEVEAPLQEGASEQTMERFRQKEILLEPGRRGQSSLHGEAQTPLILLGTITGLVLLIACANIANLLLARGAGRNAEMAIRGALGGSRRRLLSQLMTESFLLALLGGLASLLVAAWTLSIIGSLLPPDAVATLNLSISPTALLYTALLALGTGVLFGLYPALQSTRSDLASVLKSSTGQPSGARSAVRLRKALVTAQISLSMALLVSAGLFIRSLVNVSRVDLGLQSDNVLTFGISPDLNGYDDERSLALFADVERELASLPGVRTVAASLVPILAGNNWGNNVSVEGFEAGPDTDTNSRYNSVGPNYFSTLGIPLVAGREFTESDVAEAQPVAIVNEAFTRKFDLDGRNAVGKYMAFGRTEDLDMQIIGVVQDAKYAQVKDEVPPLFFTPYRQREGTGSLTFYARTDIDPTTVMGSVRGMIQSLDGNLPLEEFKSLDQQVKENVFLDRFISTMAASFAALATVLASVGLYGVLSFIVAQRTREFGLRMALGADAGRVQKLVLNQLVRMLIVGCVLGIGVALILGRAAQSLLYGMEGADPLVVVLVTGLLAAIAITAGFLPALRASRVDPMEALRYE